MSTRRVRHVVRPQLIAVVLALVATLAPLSAAEAKPKHPAPRAQAVTVDGLDLSGTMPNSTRDDLTSDFRNLGYAQRMRAEGASLNIYDADAKGGRVVHSTAMDLGTGGGAIFTPPAPGLPQVWPEFSNFTSIKANSGQGLPQTFADTYHLSSIFLAQIDGSIFISGSKGFNIDKADNPYRSLVYKVAADGSCALETCAEKVLDLPNAFHGTDPGTGRSEFRAVGVTSLSAGYAHGKPYLAVGQSDYGVAIFDMDLNPVGSFGGFANPGDPVSQNAVLAMAWDPAGQDPGTDGHITVGIMNWGYFGYSFDVNADGSTQSDYRVYQVLGGFDYSHIPLAVAIGRRPDDPDPVAAFVGSNFTIEVIDPTTTGGQALATGTLPGGGVAVNPVPRADGTGGTDWAVAVQAGPGVDNVGKVVGSMFRDSGTVTLKAQPLAVDDQGNSVNQLGDAASYREWFPGYKQGRFRLENTSADEVTVTLAADTASGSGCWYAPDGDPNALPADGVVLEPGQTSDYYTLGAYTAGLGEGGCSTVPTPEEQSGAWRAYLSVAPTNRPADTRLVNVQLERNWTVDATSDQTGGSTTLTPPTSLDSTPSGAAGMPYGYQTMAIGGPDAPTPGTAPSLTVHRVAGPTSTSAGVYRLDVGTSTWTVTGSTAKAPQVQAVIPPFHVQGLNGTSWTDIGGFLPLGKLSATSSTANGVVTTTVTVGGGTFYWENFPGTARPTTPPAPPPYTELQVVLGNGANPPTSGSVTLAGAPTFGTPEDIAQMNLVGPSATGGAATPLANGVDAVAVQVSLNATDDGPVKPPTDPAYKSVYYRFADGSLVTNLYPVTKCPDAGTPVCYDYDSFVGVQPSVTAYPFGGGQTSTRRGSATAYDYVSTTLAAADSPEQITGYPGLAATALATVATLNVGAGTTSPSSTLASGQDGRNGFSVEGCNDFDGSGTCVLPSIKNPNNLSSTTTTPALYQAGSTQSPAGPLLGIQLLTQAQTALSTLPLTWTGTYAPALASSSVNPPSSSYLVKLAAPGTFTSYSSSTRSITPKVDATLVTHGATVTVLSIPVPPATNGAARKGLPPRKGQR